MERIGGDCPLGSKCEEVVTIEGVQKLKICPWYTEVRGKDPQSEEEINEWRCAIAWMPVMMIETTQFTRQTGAAVESFRNAMVKQNEKLLAQNRVGAIEHG